MKLSLNWLKQYVDLDDLEVKQIANELTMKTAEVEEIHHLAPRMDGIVVAKVEKITSLGDSGNLASVHLGSDEERLTVCAAPNLRPGMFSIFAPSGTILTDGSKVEETVRHGHTSQGILLSPFELGISQYHDGIMDLPADLLPGTPLSRLLPGEDYIIELDNKSITHRPDLWGHYGFARELAAIFERPLKNLVLWDLNTSQHLPLYPLQIDNMELCPGYACIALDNLTPSPSPLSVQWRLYAAGMRSINLLVDLTNYVMLETGQPMHAFDGDYITSVRVAPLARDGAEFTTLDGMKRKMLASDLMIWNQQEPVGVAGVMGGLHSEVTSDTGRILLEAANFQPMTIRRTAVRLNLRTDASIRFEKDLPKSFTTLSIARFLRLCAEAGQTPVLRSRLTCAGAVTDPETVISIPSDYISRYVGENVSGPLIKKILTSLGFTCQEENEMFRVSVPPHRSRRDISIKQDIVEEVARFYGYDNIIPRLPDAAITSYTFNEEHRAEHKLRRFLSQAQGLCEVHGYSWYDDRWLTELDCNLSGPFLTLQNPTSPDKSKLRQSLIPGLLQCIRQNYDKRQEIKLYELGHCYWPENDDGSRERTFLAAVLFQAGDAEITEELFRTAKAIFEDCLRILNVPDFNYQIMDTTLNSWALAASALTVHRAEINIGSAGYLTGPILKAFKKNANIAWLEMDLTALTGTAFPEINYKPQSDFPISWLDISIMFPKAASFKMLETRLDNFRHELVMSREFISFYEGKNLDGDMRSYTFRYVIGSFQRTLTTKDIEEFRTLLLKYLHKNKLELRA
ncbi:MAG: phenylalanine--tRNA ligase subunit beta [Desulfarculales bacterium]|jgi:phenylalanyl-tRNA synthetase beta chain|nr:phenylalanine--tRNA ligase subunit beta [Desulfarculales bacterium]